MSRGRDWERRKTDATAAANADQAEFRALSYSSANLESGIADDRIADALDAYDVAEFGDAADWAKDDARFDSATSDIAREIVRRQELLKGSYPFRLSGNTIRYSGSRTLTYEFCLAVSQSRNLTSGDYVRLPRAFERLVRDVVMCFLGPEAEGYWTGWPGDKFEHRPTRFGLVIEALRRRTGEWHWDPLPDLPADPSPKHVKDIGMDFVVWRRMPDKRVGQLFLVGQCACGGDWPGKLHGLDFEKLRQWIRPFPAATPVRVFATPQHIPNDAYFAEVTRAAGLTLDRARIAMLAEATHHWTFIAKQMRDPYNELIKLVIPDFEAVRPKQKRPRKKAVVGRRSR